MSHYTKSKDNKCQKVDVISMVIFVIFSCQKGLFIFIHLEYVQYTICMGLSLHFTRILYFSLIYFHDKMCSITYILVMSWKKLGIITKQVELKLFMTC